MFNISVVIPVHKTDPVIYKCLQSILAQTCQPLEILLVQDGSDKDLHSLCLDYCDNYKNIIYYQMEKPGGAGAARNIGINKAKGDFIWFIDSDDFISTDTAVEKLYAAVSNRKVDVVLFEYGLQTESGFQDKRHFIWEQNTLQTDNGKTYTIDEIKEFLLLPAYPWNKLYRRQFLLENTICCSTTFCHNDIALSANSLIAAKHIVLLPELLIIHRVAYKQTRLSDQDGLQRMDLFIALKDLDLFINSHQVSYEVALYVLQFKLEVMWWGLGRIRPEYREEYLNEFSLQLKNAGFRPMLGLIKPGMRLSFRNRIKLLLVYFSPQLVRLLLQVLDAVGK